MGHVPVQLWWQPAPQARASGRKPPHLVHPFHPKGQKEPGPGTGGRGGIGRKAIRLPKEEPVKTQADGSWVPGMWLAGELFRICRQDDNRHLLCMVRVMMPVLPALSWRALGCVRKLLCSVLYEQNLVDIAVGDMFHHVLRAVVMVRKQLWI